MTADQYPSARRLDLTEDLSGHQVGDPYRWLEDADSVETGAWLSAQDDLFRGYAGALPGVTALAERILELTGTGHIGVPVWRDDRQFFTRRLPGQQHAVLCTLDPGAAGARTLIDPIARRVHPSGVRRGRRTTANMNKAPHLPACAAAGVIRNMTGLRSRDQRALGQIEKPLALGDPRLASMFAIFTTMTRHEPMPVTERLTPRLRRWRRRARAIMDVLFFTPSVTAGIWAYDSRWGTSGGPGKIKGNS